MTTKNELCCCIKLDRQQEIFDAIPDTGDNYATDMTEHLLHKKNVDYVIYQFWQAIYQKNEKVYIFATQLRKLATCYKFSDLDRQLKSAIIQNCYTSLSEDFHLMKITSLLMQLYQVKH